jgi:hypothetical protein
MSKHYFTTSITVCGVEEEYNAVAVYDYSHIDSTAVVYDVYIVHKEDQPFLYFEEYMTDKQFDALEAEISSSMEE